MSNITELDIEIQYKLTQLLQTKSNVLDFVDSLDALYTHKFTKNVNNPVGFDPTFDISRTLGVDNTFLVSNYEVVRNYLIGFEYVNVKLVYRPSTKFVNLLHKKIQEKIKVPIMLDLEITPNILGGLILTYKGTYADFSLKKLVQSYLEAHKSEYLAQLFS